MLACGHFRLFPVAVGFVSCVSDTRTEKERERDEWVNVQEGGDEFERRTTRPLRRSLGIG